MIKPVLNSSSVDIPQTSKNWKVNYLFVALLVVAAFIIGNLYTRVKLLEKGTTLGKQTGQNPQETSAPQKAELAVSQDDPSLGPKDAKVTIVVFEDFQCPFCGAFSGLNQDIVKQMQSRDPSWQPAFSNIKKDYVESGKARLVWKDYPFLGEESFLAAQAARCAQDQGKFWEYHDYLFSHQSGENEGAFSSSNLKKFAQTLGLKTAEFNTCLDSGKYAEKMKAAQSYGQSVGVSGTPATFVNGQLISGAAPYSQFKTTIDGVLSK